VSHLVDDAIVHGAELVQDAGHGPFRRFVVKVRVQQIRSLQRGRRNSDKNFAKTSVVGSGSELILVGWIRIKEDKENHKNRKKL
jgi:hypothetical protein